MKKNDKLSLWYKIFMTQNESQKRWMAAEKSIELGYGGVTIIGALTGLSRTTITKGINEIQHKKKLNNENRIRDIGGGRKTTIEQEGQITKELEFILNENTSGNPMKRLLWTCKSTRTIAGELNKKGINVHFTTVGHILKKLGYSLQSNKKTISSSDHPNRDDQFKHINDSVNKYINKGFPIISVDAKKKELIGRFKNNGVLWRKKGRPIEVNDHDYSSLGMGVAIPYGTYDLTRNEGFVNVGISKNTAEFAVNSIWQWWRHFGMKHYPAATKLLICADGGGSNGASNRAWKFFLQEFANKSGLTISVCHYPPGTSKWNKIEHKMFSFISMNWKGQPLENYETVINLISATRTNKGLKIKAILDKKKYKKGIKISDLDFEGINIDFCRKFPKWNYTIYPF